MKLRVSLAVAFAALAAVGHAAAQTYPGIAYGSSKKAAPSFSRAPSPSSVPGFPAPPKPPSPPPTPTFKPYEPYKAGSVYAAPKPATGGARDCELSVYVNACGRRR